MAAPTAAVPVGQRPRARSSALDRSVAMRLAETEYARFLEVLQRLAVPDWMRRTDCADWDVRAMAAHALGMAELAGSVRQQVSQLLPALRSDDVFIDALTALQVRRHEGDSPADLVAAYARQRERAVTGRRRAPGLLRRLTLPVPQAVGGVLESWTAGYLVDVILTRDTWMHRMDICRAVGATPALSADHDGVLVADVVDEWAQRHARPCRLTLSGAAGGSWSWGTGGPELVLDAVEFCRLLSGRGAGEGLLGTQVPF